MRMIKTILLVLLDMFFVNASYLIGLWLRFDGSIPVIYYNTYMVYALTVTIIHLVVFILFKLYRTMWRYANINEYIRVVAATVLGSGAAAAFLLIVDSGLPRSIYPIAMVLESFFIVAARFFSHFNLKDFVFAKNRTNYNKTLIVGAGEAGVLVMNELLKHRELGSIPVAFIDDDASKISRNINGIPVVGDRTAIEKVVKDYDISDIIIAMPSIDREDQKEILEHCHKTNAKVKIVPGYYEAIEGRVDINEIREVQIEDLLGREEVHLNQDELSTFLKDRIILITGAGGSIGSELCRQIVKYEPKQMILLDIYENSLYEIQNELKRHYKDANMVALIESIRERDRMEFVFDKYRPEVVFHAAAHKHVPLMEVSPVSAVKNNIFGTRNLIEMADKYKVAKFVNISTDKAVNPTSVMGCTKRVIEMMLQVKDKESETEFVAVRFGNVLGSNGSVIPLFKQQIKEGGPVTVTHKEMTRYFMTIPEACQLVLQAGAIAKGGEIFILDMGDEVKIDDLARNLIRLSGYIPDEDIKIVYSGLRPGEKLYEELLLDRETSTKTAYEKIFIEEPVVHDKEALDQNLEDLYEIAEQGDKGKIVAQLKKIVPNYTPDI